MPLEWIVPIIVDNVFGYVLDQSGVAQKVRSKLHLDHKREAFKRAVREAVEQFEKQHPEWALSLFDADFFKKEGASILAQFLLPDGHPTRNDHFGVPFRIVVVSKRVESCQVKKKSRRNRNC